MTIKKALLGTNEKLKNKNISSASLDAELLVSFAANQPKEYLYTHPEKVLSKRQVDKLRKIVKRRAQCEPIAYIRGFKEFYGRKFYVNKFTLIPRPESEELITYLKKEIGSKKITIADIGTGSGCLAITLKKEIPQLKVYATDISKRAISIAEKNASLHKAKITFCHGDLFGPIKNRKIDVLVANLPYLSKKVYKKNFSKLKFEPTKALLSGDDGLDAYRELFKQINNLQQKPRLIVIEIEKNQVPMLLKITKPIVTKQSVKLITV